MPAIHLFGKPVQRDPVQTADVLLVRGHSRAAIYDFRTGKVCSINSKGGKF